MTIQLIQSIDGIYFEYREMPDWADAGDERDGAEYWFDWYEMPNDYRPLEYQDFDYRGFGWCEEIDGEF